MCVYMGNLSFRIQCLIYIIYAFFEKFRIKNEQISSIVNYKQSFNWQLTNDLKFNWQLTNGQNFNYWQLTFLPHPDPHIKEVCIINCIFCRNLLCYKKLLPLKYSIDCSRDKITAYDNYLLMRNIDKGRAFLLQKMLWSCALWSGCCIFSTFTGNIGV